MRYLVLDTDAVVHARGLDLSRVLEQLLRTIEGHGLTERGAYAEMHRSGLGSVLDEWQRTQLLADAVDYRRLDNGDTLFRQLSRKLRKRGLSNADLALLVVAVKYSPAGLLTCESALADAAAEHGVLALDLFDVIRLGVRLDILTTTAAEALCQPWSDEHRAGRPRDFAGTFREESTRRDTAKPLSDLKP